MGKFGIAVVIVQNTNKFGKTCIALGFLRLVTYKKERCPVQKLRLHKYKV